MKKTVFDIFVSIILLSFFSHGGLFVNALAPSESYTHTKIVDEDQSDQYVLFWKVKNDEIQFEVHCKTNGWVGVGISPNGGMAGADIAIGWVDDKTGKGNLKDCHATSKSPPIVDKHEDWFLLDAAQKDGYTMLKMKRKLTTCDEQDKDIIDGSTFMIFAWHKDDPQNGNDWQYHGTNRRTQTALLLDFKEENLEQQENNLPSDAFAIDIRPIPVEVPQKDTLYYCEVFSLPIQTQDVHLIQYEMLINKENKDIVHHYDVYECDDDYVHNQTIAQECGHVYLPMYVNIKCQRKLFMAWSIGGQYNHSFPKEAGYPLLYSNKLKHLMITIHYDNFNLYKGRIDNSGVRFHVTPSLRKYDLGLLTLGDMGINGPLSFTVAPYTDSITFASICYPECTNFLPDDGIYAIGGIMHTHVLGRAIRTSLIRDNKIFKNILYNPNYDFNYQYIFDTQPIKIQKGDILLTECTYTSKNYSNFTFIGFSSREEMCYSFVYYYPAVKLRYCGSAASIPEIKKFYSSLMDESLIPKVEFNETDFYEQQIDMAALLTEKVNGSTLLANKYKKFFEGDYLDEPKCASTDETLLNFKTKSRYRPDRDLTEIICKSSSSAIRAASVLLNSVLVLIFFKY